MDVMESPFLANSLPSVDSFKCKVDCEEREDGLTKAVSKHMSWKRTNSSPNQDFQKSRQQELITQSQNNFLNHSVMEQSVAIQFLIKELETKEVSEQNLGDKDLAKAVYQKISKGGRYITFKQFTAAVCLLDVYKKMTVDQILAHQEEEAPRKQEKFQMLANKTKMVRRNVRNFFAASYNHSTASGKNQQTELVQTAPGKNQHTELTAYVSAPMSTTQELRGETSFPSSPSAETRKYPSLPNYVWSSVIKRGNKLGKGIRKMSRNLSVSGQTNGKFQNFESMESMEEMGPIEKRGELEKSFEKEFENSA